MDGECPTETNAIICDPQRVKERRSKGQGEIKHLKIIVGKRTTALHRLSNIYTVDL